MFPNNNRNFHHQIPPNEPSSSQNLWSGSLGSDKGGNNAAIDDYPDRREELSHQSHDSSTNTSAGMMMDNEQCILVQRQSLNSASSNSEGLPHVILHRLWVDPSVECQAMLESCCAFGYDSSAAHTHYCINPHHYRRKLSSIKKTNIDDPRIQPPLAPHSSALPLNLKVPNSSTPQPQQRQWDPNQIKQVNLETNPNSLPVFSGNTKSRHQVAESNIGERIRTSRDPISDSISNYSHNNNNAMLAPFPNCNQFGSRNDQAAFSNIMNRKAAKSSAFNIPNSSMEQQPNTMAEFRLNSAPPIKVEYTLVNFERECQVGPVFEISSQTFLVNSHLKCSWIRSMHDNSPITLISNGIVSIGGLVGLKSDFSSQLGKLRVGNGIYFRLEDEIVDGKTVDRIVLIENRSSIPIHLRYDRHVVTRGAKLSQAAATSSTVATQFSSVDAGNSVSVFSHRRFEESLASVALCGRYEQLLSFIDRLTRIDLSLDKQWQQSCFDKADRVDDVGDEDDKKTTSNGDAVEATDSAVIEDRNKSKESLLRDNSATNFAKDIQTKDNFCGDEDKDSLSLKNVEKQQQQQRQRTPSSHCLYNRSNHSQFPNCWMRIRFMTFASLIDSILEKYHIFDNS